MKDGAYLFTLNLNLLFSCSLLYMLNSRNTKTLRQPRGQWCTMLAIVEAAKVSKLVAKPAV